MKKTERYERDALEYLRRHEKMTIAQAMDLLQVSESTVRRLFRRLEETQQVLHIYGGIQLAVPPAADYSFEQVETHSMEEKRRIARCAVQLVRDGDLLFLDSGTTVAQFSAALAERIAEGGLHELIVFTNSLVNLNLLSPHVPVNLIGGEYRPARKDFCGYLAEETVKGLHFGRCFLGTDGFSPAVGFTTTDFPTARLNELVLAASSEKIVLADADKFGASAVVSYSRGQRVDCVVTDRQPAAAALEALRRDGTRIVLAVSSHL